MMKEKELKFYHIINITITHPDILENKGEIVHLMQSQHTYTETAIHLARPTKK